MIPFRTLSSMFDFVVGGSGGGVRARKRNEIGLSKQASRGYLPQLSLTHSHCSQFNSLFDFLFSFAPSTHTYFYATLHHH